MVQRLNLLQGMIIAHDANLVRLLTVANGEGRADGRDTVNGVMGFDDQAEVINGVVGINRNMAKMLV